MRFVMSDNRRENSSLPPEQQAIRAKCFHPTGEFVEFRKEEIEQSIPERFEKIVTKYFDRVAIETNDATFTYADLNQAVNHVAHSLIEVLGERLEPIIL